MINKCTRANLHTALQLLDASDEMSLIDKETSKKILEHSLDLLQQAAKEIQRKIES